MEMATGDGWIRTEREGDLLLLTAGGRWLISSLGDIDASLRKLAPGAVDQAQIDISAIEAFDTALGKTMKRVVEWALKTGRIEPDSRTGSRRR
jgi:hypothetical protein